MKITKIYYKETGYTLEEVIEKYLETMYQVDYE